jgi:hypothetical protein
MKELMLTASIFILSTQLAHADCSDLALMFSQSPDSMELSELGSLKKCVSDRLRNRLFSTGSLSVPTPPPGSPLGPMPPPAPPMMPAPPGL